MGRGLRTPQVCKKLWGSVSRRPPTGGRRTAGGRLDQAKRLKALEQEDTPLKKRVADQALDHMILHVVHTTRQLARDVVQWAEVGQLAGGA